MSLIIRRSTNQRGFVLVIALSLMAFVLLLLLSLTTLVQVETGSASAEKSKMEARQAALLAMRIAIGELQNYTGVDTRVTASSTILDESNVPLTGVWRSWEGSDRASNGKPIVPNYDAKREEGDVENALDESASAGRFLGWLASAELPDDPDALNTTTVISNTSGDDRVPMVTFGLNPSSGVSGSVVDAEDQVYISPTEIDTETGYPTRMAWWISGDNAKAMINDDPNEEPADVQAWQQRVRSNGWADPNAFDFGDDDIFSDKELASIGSLGMVAEDGSELRRFHDLTTFNRGLLTNTAVGGWRKDLSLTTESYDGETNDGDPATYSTANPLPVASRRSTYNLPFYTEKPGEVFLARKAVDGNKSVGALLYPWAEYRMRSNTDPAPWAHTGPVGSWTALVDYANQYKNLNAFSPALTKFPPSTGIVDWPSWESGTNRRLFWADKIRVSPIVSRVHWLFSLASEAVNVGTGSTARVEYQPKLLLTPVVTIWNPYNVELELPNGLDLNIQWRNQEIVPFRFKFRVGGNELYQSTGESRSQGATFAQIAPGGGYLYLTFPTNGSIILPPGGTLVLSSGDTITPVDDLANQNELPLVVGYGNEGGFLFDLQDYSTGSAQAIQVAGTESFAVEEVNVTGGLQNTISVYLNVVSGISNPTRRNPIRNWFREDNMGGSSVVDQMYPALGGGSGDLYSDQIQAFDYVTGLTHPFAAAILGTRSSTPVAASDEPEYAHLATKGMVQSNPLASYVEMRFNDQASHGGDHPANSPYVYSFRELSGWSGFEFGWVPEVAPDGSSYIVSGIQPSDGLTRCIMAELPTRPIQSLADLQHWDARNNCSVPPFNFNLIANSSATPLIPPNDVSVTGPRALNENMANDDSYLLNHVLFDDWFVSSIAPDYGNFGVGDGNPDRSISEVFREHLTGEEPLPNRFYLPVEEFESPELDDVVNAVTSGAKEDGKYGFETVASRFEVAGMFNVNSTSVDAWRALLRHSRDVEVPYIDSSGATQTDTATSFTYPRTSIAGDRGSDSGSTMSGATAAEFAGHRVLTEQQIDRLAEYIVAAIRERGPFLSLSEFVNRQLTNTVDLALAGTIQSALDELGDLGNDSLNPFRELQAGSVEITSLPPGEHDYEFPEAAYGYSAFGVPGWIRQADILRPLAPILSARDDTFTIRSYGDVRDPTGDRIISRVWCEAVVVRTANYVDQTDDATDLPFSSEIESSVNERFGRKYKIASFRWLDENEI